MEQLIANIQHALQQFATANSLHEAARELYSTMGYASDIAPTLPDPSAQGFFNEFPADNPGTQSEKITGRQIQSVQIVFQFTNDTLAQNTTRQGELKIDDQTIAESTPSYIQRENHTSFLFIAAELKKNNHTRSSYATFTREISKRFPMPVFVLFRNGNHISLAFADRRPSQRPNDDREILGKVSLIREIDSKNPHRGHLNILAQLSLRSRLEWIRNNKERENYAGLHKALLKELDAEELNKRFYDDLFKWYQWTVKEAKFPLKKEKNIETHIIRLITRMLFIWFIKEKDLVADELFTEAAIETLIKDFDGENGDNYYRAILQNLFFATLNTEINQRKFSSEDNPVHRNFNLYRYADLMKNKSNLTALMNKAPFINGGLFDCLDNEKTKKFCNDYSHLYNKQERKQAGYRIDCFTDNKTQRKQLSVPDKLFFDRQRGLFQLLSKYKFTVEESTPIEQDVALDPELLGKVFENLLAAHNPETQETARRQTGSYYTPREVVDYMVSESVIAYLLKNASPQNNNRENWQRDIGYLLNYADAFNDAAELFTASEKESIVEAVANIKVLDPAVGSGAFPMGVLHKLVLILSRLDSKNKLWRKLQEERAVQYTRRAYSKEKQTTEREERINEISKLFDRYSSDFGRKLFLIQNSIFGVDIQPTACQITRLRFFISLAIEQEVKPEQENYGIKPLPNLDTKFVAANTLFKINPKGQKGLTSEPVKAIQETIKLIMERHFHASERQQKLDCIIEFKEQQILLAKELRKIDFSKAEAEQISRWHPYDSNNTADWFEANYMFGENDGFDIVIGNPPYIRQESITNKPHIRNEYKDYFAGRADLYTYFYYRSINLLRPNGSLCFISANKFMRAGYGEKLRKFLARQTTPRIIIDFGELPVFEAGTDPAIILTDKKNPAQDDRITAAIIKKAADIKRLPEAIEQLGFSMPVSDLSADTWTLENKKVLDLLDKIRRTGKPLKTLDKVEIYRGIVTGCNDAFVIDEETKDKLIQEDPKSEELIKRWIRGQDIKKWQPATAKFYFLFVKHDCKIDEYPAVKKHLERFKSELLERSAPPPHLWYSVQSHTVYHHLFTQPKIIYADIAKLFRAQYDTSGAFCGNTVYFIPTDKVYLMAIFHSRFFDWYSRNTFQGLGDPWRGGRLRYFKQNMDKVIIPPMTEEDTAQLTTLAEIILADPDSEESKQAKLDINNIVYNLYGLEQEEIQIIESSYDSAE